MFCLRDEMHGAPFVRASVERAIKFLPRRMHGMKITKIIVVKTETVKIKVVSVSAKFMPGLRDGARHAICKHRNGTHTKKYDLLIFHLN